MTCCLTVLLRMSGSADCTGLKIVLTAAEVPSCRFDQRRCFHQIPSLAFQARSQKNCEKLLLVSSCLLVRLSVLQLSSHWADFYEIWYFPKICRENFKFDIPGSVHRSMTQLKYQKDATL
jgi:hypothetical protein